jgi:hypothetical protein
VRVVVVVVVHGAARAALILAAALFGRQSGSGSESSRLGGFQHDTAQRHTMDAKVYSDKTDSMGLAVNELGQPLTAFVNVGFFVDKQVLDPFVLARSRGRVLRSGGWNGHKHW